MLHYRQVYLDVLQFIKDNNLDTDVKVCECEGDIVKDGQIYRCEACRKFTSYEGHFIGKRLKELKGHPKLPSHDTLVQAQCYANMVVSGVMHFDFYNKTCLGPESSKFCKEIYKEVTDTDYFIIRDLHEKVYECQF